MIIADENADERREKIEI